MESTLLKATRKIDAKRTEKAVGIIKKYGGNLIEGFILLGDYDMALYLELSGVPDAIMVSIALTKLTGISFQTYPAITLTEFDKMPSAHSR